MEDAQTLRELADQVDYLITFHDADRNRGAARAKVDALLKEDDLRGAFQFLKRVQQRMQAHSDKVANGQETGEQVRLSLGMSMLDWLMADDDDVPGPYEQAHAALMALSAGSESEEDAIYRKLGLTRERVQKHAR